MEGIYKSSDIADKIRIIANLKNISINSMLNEIGLGKNTLMNFKTSMPKADNLAKIADYLDVSVDYLLGRTNDPNISDSSELNIVEKNWKLITAYKNSDMKEAVDKLLNIADAKNIPKCVHFCLFAVSQSPILPWLLSFV